MSRALTAPTADSRHDALRRVAAVLLLAALLFAAVRVVRWLAMALWAAQYPYQLDYAEGIVWQQADMMWRGVAYGDITRPPFIVFHYPPVFHLTSILVSRLFEADLLLAGRAVSVAAAIGTAGVVGVLVAGAREHALAVRRLCALVAAIAVLSFEPVARWALTYRVDVLAVFLSVLGLYFGLRSLQRHAHGYVAAACFVTAVFTKPTALAAPLALVLFMLWRRPALAWRGLLAGALWFMVAGGIAMAGFGRGLVTHILGYNINQLNPPNLKFTVLQILIHASCVGLAGVAAWRGLRERWSRGRGAADVSPGEDVLLLASLYFCTTGASTLAIVKSGADSNYLIEWFVSIGLLVGVSLLGPVSQVLGGTASPEEDDTRPQPRQAASWPPAVVVGYVLAMQFLLIRDLPQTAMFRDEQSGTRAQAVLDEIGATSRPVASEDMVLLMRARKQVIFEPMIINELVSMGLWDESPLVRMVRDEEFAFFVVRGRDEHDRTFGWPYSTLMTRAILEHYPVVTRVGDYWIRRPQGGR